jgi:coproporphyrinogen III oxidase-like Fe-S oxidoreductase
MNQNYVSAMLTELRHYQQQPPPQPPQQPKIALQSIYLGGGTPSLLPLHSLTQILHAIRHPVDDSRFTIRPDCEITLEIDPGTFTRDMLQAWYQMGITRFSIGVQSLNDTILQHLGRTHTTADIDESLRILESIVDHHHYHYDTDNSKNDDHSNTGPTQQQRQRLEYSIDLISGVPGLDITTWMDTLQQVTTLWKPHHLSIYDLQMEANTVLGRRYPQHEDDDDDRDDEAEIRFSDPTTTSTIHRNSSNKHSSDRRNTLLRLPSAQEAAFMYRYASGYLRSKSYEHYEISSYALRKNQTCPGELGSYRSRHNQIYWGYHNVSAWYAIGLGASSFDVHQQIVKRPNAMSDYIQWVHDLTTNTTTNLTDTNHTNHNRKTNDGDDDDDDDDDDDAVVEEVMDIVLKRLRTVDGLSLQYVQEHYGTLYVNAIVRGVQELLQNPQGPDLIAMSRLNDHDDKNNDATRMDQVEDRILRLVDPLGFLYSNTIISNIFYELSKTNDRAQQITAR